MTDSQKDVALVSIDNSLGVRRPSAMSGSSILWYVGTWAGRPELIRGRDTSGPWLFPGLDTAPNDGIVVCGASFWHAFGG